MTLQILCGRWCPILCTPSGVFLNCQKGYISWSVRSLMPALTYCQWYFWLHVVRLVTQGCSGSSVTQSWGINLVALWMLLWVRHIDPTTGWIEILKAPIIDQSARMYQIFNEVWLSIYPRPRKVISDNASEFKRKFIPLLKYFSVKTTCTAIKNPQENAIFGEETSFRLPITCKTYSKWYC